MSTEQERSTTEDFATLFAHEESIPTLHEGQIVKGRVVQISDDSIFVDIQDKGEAIIARAELEDGHGNLEVGVDDEIEATVVNLFSSCAARFQFVGATELVAFHRRTKTFSLNLPFVEHLATGKDSYVLLVRLEDYWHFVTDESGNLRRYLFDSNVRDFLGPSGVNDDFFAALDKIKASGVTPLALGGNATQYRWTWDAVMAGVGGKDHWQAVYVQRDPKAIKGDTQLEDRGLFALRDKDDVDHTSARL